LPLAARPASPALTALLFPPRSSGPAHSPFLGVEAPGRPGNARAPAPGFQPPHAPTRQRAPTGGWTLSLTGRPSDGLEPAAAADLPLPLNFRGRPPATVAHHPLSVACPLRLRAAASAYLPPPLAGAAHLLVSPSRRRLPPVAAAHLPPPPTFRRRRAAAVLARAAAGRVPWTCPSCYWRRRDGRPPTTCRRHLPGATLLVLQAVSRRPAGRRCRRQLKYRRRLPPVGLPGPVGRPVRHVPPSRLLCSRPLTSQAPVNDKRRCTPSILRARASGVTVRRCAPRSNAPRRPKRR